MPHLTAAILSIGDELTLGQALDTNSQWLSRRLTELGVIPVEHATVPDDLTATRDAILRLAAVADLLIITGGLGPTADDLTRASLAAALNEPLVEDPQALTQITAWFASPSRPMPALNRVQAQRPRSAAIIPNEWGTAPGLRAALGRADVYSLPGPPREMRPMFEASVVPRLRPGRIVRTRALHTFGLGESEIAQRLGDLMARDRTPTVGTTASQGVVTVRIRYESAPAGQPQPPTAHGRKPLPEGGEGDGSLAAANAIADTEARVRAAIGPYIFGTNADTQSSVLLHLLNSRNQTLATVESCTGGLLGALITETPGSSAVYRGGFVTYTNELKQQLVRVPAATFATGGPGAVSRECAQAMAAGGLEFTGADHCLSITGIAGPDGGSPEKPVGTVWIAVASRDTGPRPALSREQQSHTLAPAASPPAVLHSRRFLFPGERAYIRDWSARSALAMLRFALIGQPDLPLMRQQPSA